MDTMKTVMPFIEEEPTLERLSNIAQFVNMPLLEQEKYIREIDDVITYNNVLRKKEDEFFSKGEKQGIKKGRAEGSYKEKLEFAQKLKQKNYPIDEIIYFTNLSKEEIDAIPI